MVHEPFVDYLGGSWIQPVRALVQRSMTRTVLRRGATGVAVDSRMGGTSAVDAAPARLRCACCRCPVPFRSIASASAVAASAAGCSVRANRLVGYFGTGGPYAEAALADDRPRAGHDDGAISRSSDWARHRSSGRQAECDRRSWRPGARSRRPCRTTCRRVTCLLQPYVDGVSGRRTTTISALEHGIPVATTFGRLSEPVLEENRSGCGGAGGDAAPPGRRDRRAFVRSAQCRGADCGGRAVCRALRARRRAGAVVRGGLEAQNMGRRPMKRATARRAVTPLPAVL